jgi:hypothetical protein
MNDTLKRGDRVIVTDLRTGTQIRGEFRSGPDPTGRVTVAYDDGTGVYRMDASFVRKDDASC